MILISYGTVFALITAIWCLIRLGFTLRNRCISWKREVQLLLAYVCIVVVVRYTFFPFFTVDGVLQPLVFDPEHVLPFQINVLPFVYLFDYPTVKEILINLIGNTAMFIPLGIVWPTVFQVLNTHKKVLLAGVGASLCIEILQLPFPRVSDIDDLILNSLGFAIGYGIYLLVGKKRKKGN